MAFKKNDQGVWVPTHLDQFELGTAYSVGDWNVGPGGGRFIPSVREERALAGRLKAIREAGATHVEFHSTEAPPKSIKHIGKVLADTGLEVGMVTANLFKGRPEYANGNFGHPDPKVRHLAIEDTKQYIAFGVKVGAPVYVYWNGSNGLRVRQGVSYTDLIKWTVEGINTVLHWMWHTYREKSLAFAIENKPNEPTMLGFPATAGDVLQICNMVDEPVRHLVGGNPELCHELMYGDNFALTLARFHSMQKLFHVHLNGASGKPMFDEDLPFGSGDLMAAFEAVWQLSELDYRGLVGFDVQPRPTDTDEQYAESVNQSIDNFDIFLETIHALSDADRINLATMQQESDNASIERFFLSFLLER
ncbi:MAG: sugar phosphate isomerase/epimerase family protein [bacterium]